MTTPPELSIVLGVVVNAANQVLLIRRHGEQAWLFPGGKVEVGEEEADAIVREVQEESGIRCEVMHPLGRRVHPESKREVAYFFCKATTDAIFVKDTKEISEARWVDPETSLILLGNTVYEPAKNLLLSTARGTPIGP